MSLGEGAVYVNYPDGMGKSKLTTKAIQRLTGAACTVRNVNTVDKMLSLLGGLGDAP